MRTNKFMLNQGNETKQKILETGLQMWLEKPETVTANAIAKRLKISHGTILYHFPNGVKEAVAYYAVKIGENRVVAQLITCNHESVIDLTKEERLAILNM